MGEYTKNKKWPPDDPFFYHDGLDEVDLPEDIRARREQARAESRARRLAEEQPNFVEGSETFPLPTYVEPARGTLPDPMKNREDWRSYQQALKTVAAAFGTTVVCSQKYSYMRVQPRFDGLTRAQFDALSTLAGLVELVTGFPEGHLENLEPSDRKERGKAALRAMAEGMIKGMHRFDTDPEFWGKVKKRTF